MNKQEINSKLLYPELSYEIIGTAFAVFNSLGWGQKEKYYQNAFSIELTKKNILFEREQYLPVLYDNKIIGKYFVDLLIDGKIIVELKCRPAMGYVHINQVVSYLRQSDKKLAILIYFTKDGVRYRRIINESI